MAFPPLKSYPLATPSSLPLYPPGSYSKFKVSKSVPVSLSLFTVLSSNGRADRRKRDNEPEPDLTLMKDGFVWSWLLCLICQILGEFITFMLAYNDRTEKTPPSHLKVIP